MRNISLLLAGAVMGAATVGLVRGPLLLEDAVAANADTYAQLNLFGDIFERIRAEYVDQPEDKALVEAAITGMLTSLDPHSSYMNAERYRDRQVDIRGEFGGLGIEVTMENTFVKVVSPIDDTPAMRAGVQAGDTIVQIDGEPVEGLSLAEAVERMRGPINTSVTLTITREGQAQPLEIAITRDLIRIRSVRHRLEGEDVGYLRIASFSEQTFDGLAAAIEDIKEKAGETDLKGFVLDLRNNPGGLLDQSILVSDAFLDRGEIVSTRGRNAQDIQRRNARSGDLTDGKPIIVLVNGGSASASEIVAGALQDHRRATVIGTRSFGKGSVQTLITLGSSGALSLTTARYYTPCGRSIQARGIEPDLIVMPNVPEELQGQDTTRGEAGLRGHLQNEDGEATGLSSAYVPAEAKDDVQLQEALQLIRGEKTNAAFPPSGESLSTECVAKAEAAQANPTPRTAN